MVTVEVVGGAVAVVVAVAAGLVATTPLSEEAAGGKMLPHGCVNPVSTPFLNAFAAKLALLARGKTFGQ